MKVHERNDQHVPKPLICGDGREAGQVHHRGTLDLRADKVQSSTLVVMPGRVALLPELCASGASAQTASAISAQDYQDCGLGSSCHENCIFCIYVVMFTARCGAQLFISLPLV